MSETIKLDRSFYLRDTLKVAQDLIGKILVHVTADGITKGRIVEGEAYMGPHDKGAHTYGGKMTGRTKTMFGLGGHAYVYIIYGMYDCMNVVTREEGCPQAVLIRALEPLEGQSLMKQRRGTEKETALCSGPGKLCRAMGISRDQNWWDLCGDKLYLIDDGFRPSDKEGYEIAAGKRINIGYAEEAQDYLWRFYIKGNPHVSVKDKIIAAR